MRAQQGVSRRRMLALAAAAGGLAIGGGRHEAAAQAAKRIERLDPALDQIISTAEPIVDLATNLGGSVNVEGPLWWKEGGYLLFRGTDAKRWKYAPGQGISIFKENTHEANGITRDPQGRLVACEAAARRVAREEHDGSTTVLANSFQGRPLNRPNDIVVKSDGAVYFTDPWTLAEVPGETDLSFNGVYRISPDRGTLTLLVNDFLTPNGIAFSPDEKVLYINDTRRRHIRAFDLAPNGTLARQTDRVFADLSGPESGAPDGMKVDSAGNVFCGGAGGIYILDPNGKKLGRVVHGYGNTANIAFGDDDWKTVYFCTRTSLGSFKVKIAGVPVPVAKKA
ncbi:MAG TPA: SMP-30/gluconolactonase/LRE family protein [Xanthobacteraceae bacterium]